MTFAKAEELDYERPKLPEVQLWASVLNRWLEDLVVFDESVCKCADRNCFRCREIYTLQDEARAEVKERNAQNSIKLVVKYAGLSSSQARALFERARQIIADSSERADGHKIPANKLKRLTRGRNPY